MGGLSCPEIPCKICSRPVDLTIDLYAEEHGKPVHEDCYVKSLIGARTRTAVENLFDTLSLEPRTIHCSKCGSLFSHMETTFFSQHGKAWTVALPVCEHCSGGDSFPSVYMDA
jgi:hypothetical protein